MLDPDRPAAGLLRLLLIALAVLLLIAFVVAPARRWGTTHYVIMNHRLLFREGILARRGRDIGFSRITDVSSAQSLWERTINSGTLTIESARDSGATVLKYIPDSVGVEQPVNHMVEEDADRRAQENANYIRGGGRAGRRPGLDDEPVLTRSRYPQAESPTVATGGQLTRFAALGVDDPHLVRCAAVAPERDRSAVR